MSEEWTADTLRIYLESLIEDTNRRYSDLRQELITRKDDFDVRYNERFVSLNRSIDTAAQAMDNRLEKVNEFRAALADAQATLMPRAEARLLLDTMGTRIEATQKSINDLSQVIVALRSQLAGQTTGVSESQRQTDRQRYLIFGLIGFFFTIIIIGVSLYVGLHTNTSTTNTSTKTAQVTK